MREAIITIVEPATVNEPEHTKVFRVEFEGEADIVGESDNTDTFQLAKVVHSEQLVGHREVPGSTGH